MKKIKVILLVLFIFMLTGCGWDDVVDKYGDVIGDDGITCTYVNPSKSAINKNHKLSSIEVNISKQDGVKVSYNNSGNYTNIYSSKDDENYEHEFFFDKSSAPLDINYDNYDIETVLSKYGENGCPDHLYFIYEPTKDRSGEIVGGVSSVRNNKDDYTEMWGKIDLGPEACHVDRDEGNSIACQTYKVYYKDKVFDGIIVKDELRELYVEFGCLDDDGAVEPYFALSNKDNFDESHMKKGDNLTMPFNNNIFNVWHVDDLITIDNSSRTCSFVNSNNLEVDIDKDGRWYYFYNNQLEAPSISIEDSESSSNRYDPLTGEEWSDPDVPSGKNGYPHVIIPFQFCDATITDPSTDISSSNGTLKALKIVGILLFIAKILVPLIIIVLGSLDLAKGVIANDEKASSETLQSLVKRIIIGIVIFLLPTLLDLLIGLVDEMSTAINDGNFVNCTDCVLDPFGVCKAK